MKTSYTMYIYRTDKRCKSGERLFSTTVWADRDAETMRRECNDLYDLYPANKGWRFECHPVPSTPRPAYYEQEGGSMCNGVGRSYF